jgi:DNA-binding CsgD family transcriptional regulator
VITELDSVCRTVPAAATEAASVAELGAVISRQVDRVVRHDGYILVGMDPISSVGSFMAQENSYGASALGQMAIDFAIGPSCPLRVLVCGVPDQRYSRQLRNMAADGFGSEMRMELTHGARTWGVLVLLRERGRTGFSPADTAHAACLARPLALAVKRFVAGSKLSSLRTELPAGLIIVGDNDEIRIATPTCREALRAFTGDRVVSDADLFATIWNITYRARRTGKPVICRMLAPRGWIALHAQPLVGTTLGDVAITTQAPSAEVLLPALVAWFGVTPREQTVIEQALEGLPVKHIARRLDLSQHTVNDHFKAIYRKVGVTSREELIARLCR